ncbi:hypothetical protein QR685DRAFT_83369 [Neurospora intermedia]|uniref:Uncharacterized protein n=1 Tax=Neurospora intermedia TaxID=5142 RepID=A0ABR3D3M6_NEUIN
MYSIQKKKQQQAYVTEFWATLFGRSGKEVVLGLGTDVFLFLFLRLLSLALHLPARRIILMGSWRVWNGVKGRMDERTGRLDQMGWNLDVD